jgi:hypothetical protein
MPQGRSEHLAPRGREPRYFALAGLLVGVIGSVWSRAAAAAFTLADSLDDVLRRALPGLLAVAIGLAVWSVAAGWGDRASVLTLRVVVSAAITLVAVVLDVAVDAARSFLQHGAAVGRSRWELPLRLTITGFALGTLAELMVVLIHRLAPREDP